jgi:hypothetical protein
MSSSAIGLPDLTATDIAKDVARLVDEEDVDQFRFSASGNAGTVHLTVADNGNERTFVLEVTETTR